MKALCILTAGLGLAAWAVGAAFSDSPPAPGAAPTPPILLPKITGPFTSGNLTVFLMHGPDTAPDLKVLTLQEAIDQKKVVVHETSEVNALSVENTGDVTVFLQSGDIVRGGKQDRAIAMDLIVPKGQRVGIPSFCVEAGRWRQRGLEAAAYFAKCDNQVVGKAQKLAINDSRQQGEVWKEVANVQTKLAAKVGTPVADLVSPSSLQLTLENKKVQDKVATYEKDLADLLKGKTDVIGMAVAINGQVEGAEVYGSASLCAKLWPKLLRSAATDALAEFDEKKKFEPATTKAVETFLREAAKGEAKVLDLVAGPAPNAPAQQRQTANPPAPPQQTGSQRPSPQIADQPAPPAPPPSTPMSPPRVKIVRYDTAKTLLIECQDKEKPGLVIHRSYIAK